MNKNEVIGLTQDTISDIVNANYGPGSFNPPTVNNSSISKFLDSTPWAIIPEKLEQIYSVVEQHFAGNNIQIQADASQPYITNGVAVIPMHGTLLKRVGGLSAMSGMRSMQKMRADIDAALGNSAVSAIVLDIDSPGGTVDGTKELADYIAKADQTKPVIAYANGCTASAAYWIASHARKIYAYDTTQLGSIGVVIKHAEHSEMAKRVGVKETYIYKGKYKTVGNPSEPLSEDAKEHIQSRIDTLYEMFVDTVADQRNISKDKMLSDIATGETFIAAVALDHGLIDAIGSIEDAIAEAKTQGDKVMAEKAEAASLEEMQSQFATMQEQMTALQSDNEALRADNEKLSETITAKEEAEQEAAHLATITAQFEGTGVGEEAIAAFAKLDEEVVAVIHTEISSRQEKIKATLDELGEVDPDATSKQDENALAQPATIDEATSFIMKRDGVDVDEATDVAQAEFPDLFKLD